MATKTAKPSQSSATPTTTYEITAHLADALAAMEYLEEQVDARAAEIQAAGGELPADLAEYERAVLAKIEQLSGEGLVKLENIALVRRDLDRRVDVEKAHKAHMNAEAERYRRRQQHGERTIGRLKGLSASLFRVLGVERFDGERIKTRVQRGAMRIEPLKAESPPVEYCVETWSMRANVADDVADVLSETDPGSLGLIDRKRVFVAEFAKDDVQSALNQRALSLDERGEAIGEARPGERILLPALGVAVEFGATVIDW